jgi:hypothetical protein
MISFVLLHQFVQSLNLLGEFGDDCDTGGMFLPHSVFGVSVRVFGEFSSVFVWYLFANRRDLNLYHNKVLNK